MIICLFGPSYVGKTTIARKAASILGLPLRSCGDAVRQKAASLRLPIEQLPDKAHLTVDAATIEWGLKRSDGCMIEGRFLDAVFATAGVPIALLELRADRGCRLRRARMRNGLSFSANDLDRLDAEDASFRARIFGRDDMELPRCVLDTSTRTVDECSRWVQETVKASS
jgi:cytidylate kinase